MTAMRYHIQDTISATVEEQGNSIDLTSEDVSQIYAILRNKKTFNKTITFHDKNYAVMGMIVRNPHALKPNVKSDEDIKKDNSFWLNFPDLTPSSETVRLEISFTHPNGNRGRATYSLYSLNRKTDGWRLAYLGNPTTLMNGHNSAPVRLFEKPGFKENMELHRLGFNFFFKLLDIEPSREVLTALKYGMINLQNTQIAVHVPSKDKARDLHLLKLIYTLWSPSHTMMLGEYLGLKPSIKTDEDFTGLFLKGYSGKDNPTFTVNFYDKALSNENKKKIVKVEVKQIVDKSLRIDMTLHRRYIDLLASRALTLAKQRIKMGKHNAHYTRFIEQMEQKKTATALVMCMIIYFLPKKERITFAQFLLREIICKEMMLDKIIKARKDNIVLEKENCSSTEYEVYLKWTKSKTIEEWKRNRKALIKRLNKNYYHVAKKLETRMGVSMDVPFDFWIQLSALEGIYGLSRREVIEYTKESTITSNNPDEIIRSALRMRELITKGKKGSQAGRSNLIETFLTPIGM